MVFILLQIVGDKMVLAGNVDPMVLYCGEEVIRKSVHDCIGQAKGKHVLNLGHGMALFAVRCCCAKWIRFVSKRKNNIMCLLYY